MKNLPKINLVYDALHGMAYYTFLNSLRSLEEFRKNSHAKIPSKSPCTNFQSWQKKFEFQITKIQKGFITCIGPSFGFRPSHSPPPFSFPNWPFFPFPTGPWPLSRPVGPVGHAPVAPCLLAASLTGRCLQPCRPCPSPRQADRWAPPVIPHL
jgi:hypothetical protein